MLSGVATADNVMKSLTGHAVLPRRRTSRGEGGSGYGSRTCWWNSALPLLTTTSADRSVPATFTP